MCLHMCRWIWVGDYSDSLCQLSVVSRIDTHLSFHKVEQRIEEAWFQRGKEAWDHAWLRVSISRRFKTHELNDIAWFGKAFEAWYLGLPPKPDLFDFLQCQAKAAVEPRILSFNKKKDSLVTQCPTRCV